MSVPDPVAFGTARGRWVLAAAVLGSGIAFLDGSVVNVALPAIARRVQRRGRRVAVDADLVPAHARVACSCWAAASATCTAAVVSSSTGSSGSRSRRCSALWRRDPTQLEIARALQGVAAAALVPGSLALLSSSFRVEDRGRAIGAWSGLAGVATAAAPFLGGWVIDAVSWRLVFLINLPLVVVAVVITMRWVPESRDDEQGVQIDVVGAVTLSIGLAGVVYALIEGPAGASTGGRRRRRSRRSRLPWWRSSSSKRGKSIRWCR